MECLEIQVYPDREAKLGYPEYLADLVEKAKMVDLVGEETMDSLVQRVREVFLENLGVKAPLVTPVQMDFLVILGSLGNEGFLENLD